MLQRIFSFLYLLFVLISPAIAAENGLLLQEVNWKALQDAIALVAHMPKAAMVLSNLNHFLP